MRIQQKITFVKGKVSQYLFVPFLENWCMVWNFIYCFAA